MDVLLISSTILFIIFKLSRSMDIELVFLLRKHFRSDLILIASDDNYNINLLKEFYIQTSAFIHVININSERFSEYFKCRYQDIMVVSDDKINLIGKLGKYSNTSQNLMNSAIWIHFFKENLTNEFENLYIPFDCEFLIIKEINPLNYEMKEVHQISEDTQKIYTNFGVWKNKKLEVSGDDFFKRRTDLKGYQFKLFETFLKQYTRKYHLLWELFAQTMNFSIYYDPRDYGELFQNGTKTGVFKLLHERKIHGSVHNYLYLENRAKHFDFIFPTMILETKFYLEQKNELNWASYLSPFSSEVRLSILLWVIISSFVIHIINRLHRRTSSEASYFIILKALFGQAGTVNFSTTSLYISYLMPYFLSMILTQYYSGVLLSYLTVYEKHSKFENLQDIIQDGTYKLSALNGTIIPFFLKNDPGPMASAVRQKNLLVKDDEMPTDTFIAFDQICVNRWIYIGRTSNIIVRGKCQIVELDQILFKNLAGIMVYKGFPFREIMTRLLKKFQFAGLIKLYQKDLIYSNEELNVFQPFTINLALPLFLLYLIFIILSLFILLIECMWKE